jgi:hypothetical protein
VQQVHTRTRTHVHSHTHTRAYLHKGNYRHRQTHRHTPLRGECCRFGAGGPRPQHHSELRSETAPPLPSSEHYSEHSEQCRPFGAVVLSVLREASPTSVFPYPLAYWIALPSILMRMTCEGMNVCVRTHTPARNDIQTYLLVDCCRYDPSRSVACADHHSRACRIALLSILMHTTYEGMNVCEHIDTGTK